MKKIGYMFVWSFLAALFLASCFEDDDKYNYDELDPVSIQGIEENYSRIAHQDILTITPTVNTKADVDYIWELYDGARRDGVDYRPDTIGLEKDLRYEVNLTPGTYYLIFNVRDKKSGVSTRQFIHLNVVTINSTGWYLLKDEGTADKYTDYDFIYENGRIDNWIAFYNKGKKLKGEAVKSVFAAQYSRGSAPSEVGSYISVLMPVAREEILLMDLASGSVERTFESLFFELPGKKDFRNINIANDGQNFQLINDNKYSLMSGRGRGSFYELFGDFDVSDYRFNGLMSPILFDKRSKSFLYVSASTLSKYLEAATAPISCNDMHADILWGSSINFRAQSNGWMAYCLMEKEADTETYLLVKVSGAYNSGNTNPIKEVKMLPANSGLITAERRAVNADYGIIYFVKDQKLYRHLIDNQHEEIVFDLPAGEEVTCMQHIAYPSPMVNEYGSEINYFAIATYANGKYKVWLHEFDAGNPKPLDKPTFEGNGRIACINYVSNNMSNFLY